jgi:type III secretion protein R
MASATRDVRIERDAHGELEVRADRYWGAQTQRALLHFEVGTELWPPSFVHALGLIKQAAEPFRGFLMKHSGKKERVFFVQAAQKLWPPERAADLQEDDLLVLVPAFTVGELTSAFQIGFLLYLPFVAIDLIISNILLAMGMMMVSPTTISLPFKLLLFVLVDGWGRLIHGLVLTYA